MSLIRVLPRDQQPQKRGFWVVPPMWEGETVFVIGGGPSLSKMDLEPIKDRCVLGVNNAWTLGDWVKINYFGDQRWWTWNSDKILEGYGGLIVTDCPIGVFENHPRVLHLIRDNSNVIHWKHKNRVGWFKNSGGTALNLAIHLGAAKIVLLGFDMQVTDGEPNKGHNWHNEHRHSPRPDIYQRFMGAMGTIPQSLIRMEAETGRRVVIVNASPNTAMDLFPKVRLEDIL